jgi:hypothetical protein
MALSCQDGAMVLLYRSPCTSSEAEREGRDHCHDDDDHSKAASGKETLLGLRLTDPVYRSYYDSSSRAAAAAATTASTSHALIKWTLLQNGAALSSSASTSLVCCTMTGFAPDVDYITGVLLQLVENHHTLYSSSSGSSSISQVDFDSGKSTRSGTMQRWIQVISDFLREPGQFQGGRPYGIQALLIGRRHHLATKRRAGVDGDVCTDATSNSAPGVRSSLLNRHPLRVVTFDPSGGYRDWPLGVTAIGRWAKEVRRQLVQTCIEATTTSTTTTVSNGDAATRVATTTIRPEGPVKAASASALVDAPVKAALVDWQHRTGAQALRWGLQASMAVVTASTQTESHDEHYYQAWLLWPNNNADCDNYCMAQVDGRQVKELQDSILAERQPPATQ